MPVEIFCCYARKDQRLLQNLKAHLMPLQREGLVIIWSDMDINAGKEWEEEITKHLNAAQIILLLISPDFMMSEYSYGNEMKRAIERHKRGEASVIPIILRRVSWERTPFGGLQALPKNGKPIKNWQNRDEAFYNVVEDIRKVVEEFKSKPVTTKLRIAELAGISESNLRDNNRSANHDGDNTPTVTNPAQIFQNPTELRNAMHKALSREDFKLLCFDLGVSYDDLEGEILAVKMQSLIDYFRRRNRYQELVQKILQLCPYLADGQSIEEH